MVFKLINRKANSAVLEVKGQHGGPAQGVTRMVPVVTMANGEVDPVEIAAHVSNEKWLMRKLVSDRYSRIQEVSNGG